MKKLSPFIRRMSCKGGFLLLECMIAVFMFAIGLIALGDCVQNLIRAERYKREDARARQVLNNYFLKIEGEELKITENFSQELTDAFAGMKINVEREELKPINEKEQELFGLYQIRLEVEWESDGERMTRDLSFMIYRPVPTLMPGGETGGQNGAPRGGQPNPNPGGGGRTLPRLDVENLGR